MIPIHIWRRYPEISHAINKKGRTEAIFPNQHVAKIRGRFFHIHRNSGTGMEMVDFLYSKKRTNTRKLMKEKSRQKWCVLCEPWPVRRRNASTFALIHQANTRRFIFPTQIRNKSELPNAIRGGSRGLLLISQSIFSIVLFEEAHIAFFMYWYSLASISRPTKPFCQLFRSFTFFMNRSYLSLKFTLRIFIYNGYFFERSSF